MSNLFLFDIYFTNTSSCCCICHGGGRVVLGYAAVRIVFIYDVVKSHVGGVTNVCASDVGWG